jgi:hypothetical protein
MTTTFARKNSQSTERSSDFTARRDSALSAGVWPGRRCLCTDCDVMAKGLGSQTEMPSEVRKIDPSLRLGLHELANSVEGRGSFSFQLAFAKQQTEDILRNLDSLVKNTTDNAPDRKKGFCLDRGTYPPLIHEEAKWEREMHQKWGPEGSGEYVPVCKRIQTYQYPLQASFKDSCWGKIDLLGIGTDFLPVPNELKKRKTNESPLRMLVEVAAYGFAIRKVWPNLKDCWVKAVRRFEESPSHFPAYLDKVTLVGVAPEEYWCRCLGRMPGIKAGAFPTGAWPPFWKLVDALGKKGFDIHFVAVQGSWDDAAGRPIITGARVLELRSLSGRHS